MDGLPYKIILWRKKQYLSVVQARHVQSKTNAATMLTDNTRPFQLNTYLMLLYYLGHHRKGLQLFYSNFMTLFVTTLESHHFFIQLNFVDIF